MTRLRLTNAAVEKLLPRPGTSASAIVQVALGLIFVGAQFALALAGLWLLFVPFSAVLIAMPTLALTKRDVWRDVVGAMVDADVDANRVRRKATLFAARAFSLTTVLAVVLALTIDS